MEQNQQYKKTISDHQKNIVKEHKDDHPREIGGPKGLEPTRYGDWEKNGRCIDF